MVEEERDAFLKEIDNDFEEGGIADQKFNY